MDFIAIDFETASSKHSSPCSLGITVVKNSVIVDCRTYLINPETKFSEFNIGIHGIHPEDVENSPTFAELWPEIFPLFRHYPIVAHNVAFDRNVLLTTLERYGLTVPPMTFYCTLQLTQENYNFQRYTLDAVCQYLNIELCHHHDCNSDSVACAEIMLHLLSDEDTFIHDAAAAPLHPHKPISNLTIQIDSHISNLYDDIPEDSDDFQELSDEIVESVHKLPELDYTDDYSFDGMSVVITGEIPNYQRSEVISYIESHGGVFKSTVTRNTNLVIVGYEDSELVGDKVTFKSRKILKAEELISKGRNIIFVSGVNLSEHMKQEL